MSRCLLSFALAGLTLGGAAGCGAKTYPVEGKVVWPDGRPAVELAGCRVSFESAETPVGADGVVQNDGTFRLSTYKPDDGAVAGRHRVAVTPPDPLHDVDAPRPKAVIHPRFRDFATSKLEATVERKANDIPLTVERAK